MELSLYRPNLDDQVGICDMMTEWEGTNDRIVPGIIRNYKPDFPAFLDLLERCHSGIGLEDNQVPSTIYDSTATSINASQIKPSNYKIKNLFYV